MDQRVLVVGWDGAEPAIVSALLAAGRLPRLAALTQDGYFGPVNSTMRPESSVAWTSFATGVSPGEHGIYGFARRLPNSYLTQLNNSAAVPVPFFWDRASELGKRVAVLNMPMAYPPRPVSGFLVAGQMTPGTNAVFTYPPELGAKLLSQGYVIDAEAIAGGEDRGKYASRMRGQVEQRARVALELLGDLSWDLGVVIFTELDRLQHYFWADMDAQHPLRPRQPVDNAIVEHYTALDSALGRLADMAGPGARVIVMSDHGFGPCSRTFYVNEWLARTGWLKRKDSPVRLSLGVAELAARARNAPLLRSLKKRLLGDRSIVAAVQKRASLQQIDWPGTRAWYAETGGIHINVRGREPEGIVDPGREYEQAAAEIIASALELRDPHSNLPVIEKAFRRDELYQGPMVPVAPDIILDTYHPQGHALQNHVLSPLLTAGSGDAFGSSHPFTGTHTLQGICAANAAPPPHITIARIEDITRWVMASLGLSETGGERGGGSPPGGETGYSNEQDALLRKRLQALGYLE